MNQFRAYIEKQTTPANPGAPVGTPDNPSNQVLTVANLVTISRIVLTLVFLLLFVNHANRYVCLAIYAIAAITDFLDGQIARRTQTVSWFGKLLDPVMDRILLFTGVIGLCVREELPVWIVCVIIGRDVILALGALALQNYQRRPINVVFIGKVATALLLTGFSWLLLGAPVLPGFDWVHVSWLPLLNATAACPGMLLVYAGTVCSVITGAIYIAEGAVIRRRVLAQKREG